MAACLTLRYRWPLNHGERLQIIHFLHDSACPGRFDNLSSGSNSVGDVQLCFFFVAFLLRFNHLFYLVLALVKITQGLF